MRLNTIQKLMKNYFIKILQQQQFLHNKQIFISTPDESFISPLRQQWKRFLSSPSNSSSVNKNCLKTPSPARMMEQSLGICC
uniref:Uncharacterized protein n=1 Tax=Meloidogyne enterolobii TaxID=390850 RepID=A0A6V7V9K9_MELEN|nr:unnamed protein product [Meloidogyne enterolobii]